MILITGATGHLGAAVIENLLEKINPSEIAIYARDEKKAQKWKDLGLSVRLGNYDNKKDVEKACVGVDSLLLIPIASPGAFGQHKNVIDAAAESGIKHLYFASGALNRHVQESKLGYLNDSYFLTENHIRQSGCQYTIFQNGLNSDTIPFFIGEHLPINGINFPVGHGKSAFATIADIAEAMAKIIIKRDDSNVTYVLTGNQSYSFIEVADILSDLSGHEVPFLNSNQEFFVSALKQHGVEDEKISIALRFSQIINNDEYNYCDGTLEQILQRKPTTLREYLKFTYVP
ncbi:NAD(P)H-binding protein [Pedobacter petrophilus]|uniref:NAD(P)H-binding protein n=2 Tax=Pedobacter TaxID=84567 RepID=A0A7K0G4S0_9SPHI|nr:NmrA family NAD(P)-binding protein [Pedobacter petrophilus]MRX78805.1 NAD(P)H-binding protein [Pedobacter petrophilus]